MTDPASSQVTSTGEGPEEVVQEAFDPDSPLGSVLEGLADALQERRHELLDRVHERLWEPLRRTAYRLGALRDEAMESEDELRDAGRAVRMACDDLEELVPWDVLAGELTRHLEDVAGLAHAVPKSLDLSGPSGAEGGRVPARAAVRVALSHEYAYALGAALDPEALVVRPARALPRSPADLLRPEDDAGALAEAVDRAERHLRIVLEEAAARGIRAAGRLAADRGLVGRLRIRWRLSRSDGHRRNAALSVDGELRRAAGSARRHLNDRRFAADLARRKRALNEAASETAERLEAAAGRAGALRQLADRLEEAGRRAARSVSGEERRIDASSPASRLAEIHGRVLEVTGALRSSLPAMDRPEAPFPRALDRTVLLSRALFELSGSRGADRRVPDRGEGPGPEAAAELRARVSRSVAEVREQIWEAEQILGQGVRAARAAVASGTIEESELAELVRTTGERTARRLRAAAGELEGGVGRAAGAVRELPEELIGEIRRRMQAPGAEGSWGRWRRRLGALEEKAARLLRKATARLGPPLRDLRDALARLLPASGAGGLGRRLGKAGAGADFTREVAAGELRRREMDMEGLPLLYRWLFRPEPLDDPHLLTGRSEEMERLREVADRWRAGGDGCVAVVGEPDSGKTTLLNCWTHELGGSAPLRRGRVDRRLSEPGETARWLAGFLGLDAVPDVRDAADLARALGERREIVLLENGERLFRREVGGFGAVETLAEVMERTSGRLAWVVSFSLEAWLYLQTVTALEGPFGDVVRLGPLDRDELREAVLSRHRLTGFDLRFMTEEGMSRRRRKRLEGAPEEERQALLREWYFDDLHRSARRTVGWAFHLWRASLRSGGQGEVRVLPLRTPEPDFLDDLDRETLFLLAAFVLHGDLDRADVGRLASTDVDRSRERLYRLERLGVLRPVEGLPPPAPLRVDRWLHAPVIGALRDQRLLHL